MAWLDPLLLTVTLMIASVTIATVVGIGGAWAGWTLSRGGVAARWVANLFFAAVIAAVAMPMILHATAWEATAGKFGWWMLTQTGVRTDAAGVYGFFAGGVATGWIHGVVGASLVTIATWIGTSRVSESTMAMASLEMSPSASFFRVALPMAAPWWITAMVATAMLAATEMTVADLYGFRTIADKFYLFYALDPDVASVMAICFVPLVVTTAAMLAASVWRRRLVTQTERQSLPSVAPEPISIASQIFATGVAIAIGSILVGIPLFGLLFKAGQDVVLVDDVASIQWSAELLIQRLSQAPTIFAAEYQWTAVIAALTASVCVLIAWPAAFMGRSHRRAERWLDVGSLAMVCVPGPIVGLIVVRMFQSGVPGMTTLYQQTIVPTVIALSFRAGAAAYWILRSGYRGIDRVVLESAAMEMSGPRRFWTIDRRLLIRPAMAAWLAAALVASGDVPAMLPVIPAGVTTVSVRLFGLLHSGARYQEAALAFWYIAAAVAIAFLTFSLPARRRPSARR